MEGQVEIRVKGHIDVDWSEWFDGYDLTHQENNETTLTGPFHDQTTLYSLISRLRDLGLALVSVETSELYENNEPLQTAEEDMLSA